MQAWMMWMVAGVVLFILELVSMTFFLLWIGVAAIITGVVAIGVPTLWVQWLVFAIASVVLLIATRPLARSVHGSVTQPSNVDAMMGSRALVIEAIDPLKNSGRVRVGSEEWRARAEERIGEEVWTEIIGLEGTTLVVRRAVDTEVTSSEQGETELSQK